MVNFNENTGFALPFYSEGAVSGDYGYKSKENNDSKQNTVPILYCLEVYV